ncbi:MAG: PilZ domain-containing protein [Myxococcota bacterium]
MEVDLPQELRGKALATLSGRVARVESCPAPGGRSGFSVAVELEPLSPEAARDLDAILSGTNPATRISALSAPHKRERRRTERRAYRRRVAALSAADAGSPRVALGHDLSVAGIRIARQPGLSKGTRVAIGLYGAEGGVPLTLEAEVVADHGPRGLGLAFLRVTVEQRLALEKLVAALPLLESLANDGDGGPALVVLSVLAQNA